MPIDGRRTEPARPEPTASVARMTIGEPFRCDETPASEVFASLDRACLVCANEPPWADFWSTVAARTQVPVTALTAWDMDQRALESMADGARSADAEVVIGFGGGTALDTAKFMAWRLGLPLVQIPTICSVDASFTDAIGVRADGRVRYVGTVVPERVVLDVELIRSAPPRLNRAGIGDVLSCHTGLFDWQLAAEAGHGVPWHDEVAALGRQLLVELDAALDEVAAVTPAGVRFLADAYRRIGAACAAVGHSRFEEGSEHFWAYAYEHATGAHPVHGEIISMAVCAMAHVQGNDPEWAAEAVRRAGVRAHPVDLGVTEPEFRASLAGLAAHARAEGLDVSVVDLRPVTDAQITAAWQFVNSLPRR